MDKVQDKLLVNKKINYKEDTFYYECLLVDMLQDLETVAEQCNTVKEFILALLQNYYENLINYDGWLNRDLDNSEHEFFDLVTTHNESNAKFDVDYFLNLVYKLNGEPVK